MSDGVPMKLDYASPHPASPSSFEQGIKAVLAVIAILLGLLFVGLLAMTAL